MGIRKSQKEESRAFLKTLMMKTINLKDLLRATLTKVEKSTDLHDDGLALVELKHSLVRSVAELDVKRELKPPGEESAPFGICTGASMDR